MATLGIFMTVQIIIIGGVVIYAVYGHHKYVHLIVTYLSIGIINTANIILFTDKIAYFQRAKISIFHFKRMVYIS